MVKDLIDEFLLLLPPRKPTYPLKIDGWKMTFPFQMVPFSGDMFFFFWGVYFKKSFLKSTGVISVTFWR